MDNEDTTLAEILHSIFCTFDHEDEMEALANRNPTTCYWYLEESIDEYWKQQDHLTWLIKARQFSELCEAGGLDKAGTTNATADLIEVCHHLVEFYDINPNLREWVVNLVTKL